MTLTTHWENVPTSFCSELSNEEKSSVPHETRQGETGQHRLDPLGFALTGHLTIEVASLRTSFPRLQDEEAGLNDDRGTRGGRSCVSDTVLKGFDVFLHTSHQSFKNS